MSARYAQFALIAALALIGSLTIKMLDPVSSEILWTGHLGELKITVVEPQKQLNKAVWRVLVEFPPITG